MTLPDYSPADLLQAAVFFTLFSVVLGRAFSLNSRSTTAPRSWLGRRILSITFGPLLETTVQVAGVGQRPLTTGRKTPVMSRQPATHNTDQIRSCGPRILFPGLAPADLIKKKSGPAASETRYAQLGIRPSCYCRHCFSSKVRVGGHGSLHISIVSACITIDRVLTSRERTGSCAANRCGLMSNDCNIGCL